MKKIRLTESQLIGFIKNCINESWDDINKILEKISKSGIDNISKKEKEYLDHYSETGEFLDYDDLVTTTDRVNSGEIWNFDGVDGLPKMKFKYETTEEHPDEIVHTGYLEVNNDEFYGEIYCDLEGNYSLCNFESSDGENIFEKYEGLEHEIGSFLSIVCDDLKGDLMS
jgi:hypothetical protein